MAWASNEELFPVWREPRSFWERTGLTPEQRRRLDLALAALVIVILFGWMYATVEALRAGGVPQIARRVASNPTPLSPGAPPGAAFLLDAALRQFVSAEDFRGHSGEVRVVVRQPGESGPVPDSLPAGVQPGYQPVGGTAAPVATSAATTRPTTSTRCSRSPAAAAPRPRNYSKTSAPAGAAISSRSSPS